MSRPRIWHVKVPNTDGRTWDVVWTGTRQSCAEWLFCHPDLEWNKYLIEEEAL